MCEMLLVGNLATLFKDMSIRGPDDLEICTIFDLVQYQTTGWPMGQGEIRNAMVGLAATRFGLAEHVPAGVENIELSALMHRRNNKCLRASAGALMRGYMYTDQPCNVHTACTHVSSLRT